MAPSADRDAASPSSKKRKSVVNTPETSKKRRKHENVEDSNEASQETASIKKDRKKEKREKKEKKAKKERKEKAKSPELSEAEDVEIPDAPSEEPPPAAEDMQENELEVDGLSTPDAVVEFDETLLQSQQASCFYEKRLSLQLPIPSVSLASPTSSLLSLHLAPLLLTYFPPADGIVLSFSDPVLSAIPSYGVNLPLKSPKSGEIPRNPPSETFARCADQFGVCWVWLTVTFLTFRPDTGDELKGWMNVASEGFVGLVSYNYFQTAVGKSRIPKAWTWDGPMRESAKSNRKKKTRKEKLRDESGTPVSQEEADSIQETAQEDDGMVGLSGSFVDSDGNNITSTQTFRVVDVEMVPGHEKDRWTLQIDGSLLSSDEEREVMEEERRRFEQVHSRSKTPGPDEENIPLMSGDYSLSRATSPS